MLVPPLPSYNTSAPLSVKVSDFSCVTLELFLVQSGSVDEHSENLEAQWTILYPQQKEEQGKSSSPKKCAAQPPPLLAQLHQPLGPGQVRCLVAFFTYSCFDSSLWLEVQMPFFIQLIYFLITPTDGSSSNLLLVLCCDAILKPCFLQALCFNFNQLIHLTYSLHLSCQFYLFSRHQRILLVCKHEGFGCVFLFYENKDIQSHISIFKLSLSVTIEKGLFSFDDLANDNHASWNYRLIMNFFLTLALLL